MTTVQILNGIDTIGGNVVSFTNGSTQLIMDLGVNFAPDLQTAADLYADGLLPQVPNLFTNDKTREEQPIVFISHLHLDHMGALKYLTRPTDVYMSPMSYKLYQSLVQQGLEAAPNAKLHLLKPEIPYRFGNLTVTGYASDHDEAGALMLKVYDGQHTFVHSGDVRWDGPHPERVTHWVNLLQQENIDLLLLEGTEFSFDNDDKAARLTEHALQVRLQKILVASSELVVINPYERNVERLAALIQSAQSAGRQIVWDQRFGQILQDVLQIDALVLNRDVTWDAIEQNPQAYVVQNHFKDLQELNHFTQPFRYLHLNGEPLGEYDPRYQVLVTYLKQHQVALELLGASGHAKPVDLVRIAQAVHAKLTLSWHSFKPERLAAALKAQGLSVQVPVQNEIFEF
ncbi:MBL fold metallo-hydrolase [Weissella kandleri]|uniref:MBL fold metallo-hydrolase n=1 Tax=Weissella kandleri TaxID=1616 RepID=UPI00387E7FDC